jgi:hypothetical protein
MESIRVSGQRVGSSGERLRRIAVLTAIGSLCVIPQARAQTYYWWDSSPGITRYAPMVPPRKPGVRRHSQPKAAAENASAKPQGPLIISISIAEQKLRLYDAKGLFAESPVSTGVPGHPTPMGVFSVIQKQRFHRSNIYSGAPMPFMQRITWSGVALHAGVVPGHPASHGCIRMPAAFATKMWNWTKLGARVVITPGAVSPTDFSHPLLAAVKTPPQPPAAEEPRSDVAPIPASQKADTRTEAAPAASEAKAELRSTIGHEDGAKPTAHEPQATTTPQTQTADASGALPPSAAISDSAPAGERTLPAAGPAVSNKQDAASPGLAAEISKAEADPRTAKKDESALPGEKAAGDAPAKAQSTPASGSKVKSAEQGSAATPADLAPPATAAPVSPNNQPLQDVLPKPTPKPDPTALIKRSSQIAVFVSRKDSKLYVRQNFSPLFAVPATIAADERPLGTHVFTARVDNGDANILHWSVVSLPAPARHADRRKEVQRWSGGRKIASPPAIAQPLPDSPAEALDRLTLPPDVMARIFDAISTGGSIIVSDQGIAAGETGEGTDFIVSLR